MLPLQQPLGHELALQPHVPLPHASPFGHEPHAAPPVPQEVLDCEEYASQVPVDVQQPIGQEALLHTQLPLALHTWPVGHAAQVAPLLPHEVLPSLESASHAPAVVQHPAHAPPPHEQLPFVHESPELHELHAAPAVPHCEPDCEA